MNMMKHPYTMIHGHSKTQLEQLLSEACDIIDRDVKLDSYLLGGWSNLNISGISNDVTFVLKLPWSTLHFDFNPYTHHHNLLSQLSMTDIAPKPLATGCLLDKNETPFIVLQYYDGNFLSSIEDAVSDKLQSLKKALHLFSLQTPSNLPIYKTAMEYLSQMYALVNDHDYLTSSSIEIQDMVDELNKHFKPLSSTYEYANEWPKKLMHCDFWEPNILFHDERVILLDCESCCYGEPLYDLAYLMEANEKHHTHLPTILCSDDTNHHTMYSLRPLAVVSLITWSLERLISMDAGIVEKNLSSKGIKQRIMRFTNTKLSRLKSLLD